MARIFIFVFTLVALPLGGCQEQKSAPVDSITLATTTSMQDSGMLDVLLPQFKAETGIDVRVVAVGSGQAMEIGRRGDADVLITHSPAAEETFLAEGAGIDRRSVMYNDFVLVGPAQDPAKTGAAQSAPEAFRRVATEKQSFLSRGDDSGTHHKELAIWKQAGIEPAGSWYLKGGVGMAQALRMASEKNAYLLTDRGTFLALQAQLRLEILYEGDPTLRNIYSVILVNPERHPGTNSAAAKKFATFLTSAATRQRIAEFGTEKFGQPLFHPAD